MTRRSTAYEFPVFHGGLRICMGMNTALLEAKLFIAILLRHFHVKIQDGEQLKNRADSYAPALSMVGGLPLELTPRTPASA
ncbi:hypothetical protein PybrP1_007295 [[Pythium] brassicae (nom. inval.)]|nr:hypothetical protein PybrP1_007295 [[Pythium] brassicae (nom. inval.)]